MEILNQQPLKSSPLIAGTEDFAIVFPTPGVTHILELCCKAHTGNWPAGATIAVGFLAFDSHSTANGDYDQGGFETFVPMFDATGSPLVITRNCALPIAPPRSGTLILRAVSMPSCYVACHPNQETRPQSSVWLPSLE